MRIFRSTTLDSNANTYVGDYSTLFVGNDYVLRISDNTTPGGVTIQGSEGVVQSATPPDDPTPNSLWYNTDTGRLYVYYEGVWVDAAPALAGPTGPTGPTGTGATGPTGPASTGDITFTGNVIGSSNGNIVIDTALVPSGNATIDLGTIDNQWRSLYVSGQTVYLAGVPLSVSDGNTLSFGNTVVATSSNVPTTVTSNITFSNTTIGTVNTDSDVNINVMFDGNAHVWTFGADGGTTFPTLTVPISDSASPSGTGQTIKFSDSSQQAIIYGPASTSEFLDAERIIIQGAPGYTGTTGEGGDVYLWAGPGGSTNGNGGDIKVRAGYGPGTGQGGYLNFQAGDSADGAGGHINIESGQSGTYGSGGYITVTARSGGDIDVVAEGGGKITLITDAEGGYNNWQFGNSGNLTLPGGGIITDSAETVIISGAGTSAVNQTYGKIFTGQYIGQTDSAYVIDPPEAPSTTYKLRIPEDAGGLYESEDLVTWTIVAGAGGGAAPAPTGVIVAQHITVTVDSSDWTFDSTGNLTVPAGGTINFSDGSNALAGTGNVTFSDINVIGTGNLNLQPDPNDSSAYLDIYLTGGPVQDIHIAGGVQNLILGRDDGANVSVTATGNVTIKADAGTPHVWTFGPTGLLTLPRDVAGNTDPYLQLQGGATPTIVSSDVSLMGPANLAIVSNYLNLSGYNGAKVAIYADAGEILGDANLVFTANAAGNTTSSWTFDNNGNLTLPAGGTINFSDGSNALVDGGAVNTGNVTFSDINVIGTGNLNLQPDPNDSGAYLDIYQTAGPDIHIAGNGQNLILGRDDGANVSVNTSGNVTIQTDVGTPQVWTFGNDGGVTLPEGGIINESTDIVTVTLDQFTDGGYPGTQVFYKVSDTLYEESPGGPYMDLIGGIWRLKISTSTYYDSTDLITWGTVAGGLPTPIGTLDTSVTTNLTVGGNVWSFGSTGNLTLPTSGGIVNNSNVWTFSADGNTVFPTNISIDYSGGNVQFPRIIADSEKAFSVQGQGASGSAALAWTVDPNAAGQYAQIGVTKNGGDNLAKVILTAQSDSSNVATAKTWRFDETGNLTLPPGGNINAAPTVDYGDGNSIVLTAGSTTGCVHVGGSIILNAGSGGASGGIERGGNILLNTNSGTWAFGNDGNLTFPTGNLVITDDNASLGNAAVISSADHNLITLSTGVNGGTSSLWVEDYASIGTSNIAAVYSNPVPGSAIVRIVAGQNGGPGPNLWDFGADGSLTLPAGGTVSYTPTTASDWSNPPPTTLESALDRLAAVVKVLNGGVGA